MTASVQFLTPWCAFVALAALLPLGALVVAGRRVARIRRVLRLGRPRGRSLVVDLSALAAAAALLAAAAMQPALVEKRGVRVRTDAQVLVVVDTSDSMRAAPRAGAPTRFDRARAAAVRLRGALSGIETGLATMTDRVVPDLLPVGDAASFDTTAVRALAIDSPPPRQATVVATSLDALADVPPGGFFAEGTRRRVVIVLTDGETRPYDLGAVAAAFAARPAVSLVLIRFGGPRDRVFSGSTPDPAYRADPQAGAQLSALARATGGALFAEGQIDEAARAAHAALGSGPTALRGAGLRPVTLAPWLALAALLPLLLLGLRSAGFALHLRGDTIAGGKRSLGDPGPTPKWRAI